MDSWERQEIKKKLNAALEEFKTDSEFEISTSTVDKESKELFLSIIKNVFYLVDEVSEILTKG